MTHNITFITSNSAKTEQLRRHLDYPVSHRALDLVEIQSLDLREIVEHKAKEVYKQIKKPVLVEDVSLTFLTLGKLPGPLIKWFLEELDNDGLCKILDGYKNRSALAEVCYGFYNGKVLKIFEGHMEGTIAQKPRGKRGFGWNPIFIPIGHHKTLGEMSLEEQNKISMRRVALEKLGKFLKR